MVNYLAGTTANLFARAFMRACLFCGFVGSAVLLFTPRRRWGGSGGGGVPVLGELEGIRPSIEFLTLVCPIMGYCTPLFKGGCRGLNAI